MSARTIKCDADSRRESSAFADTTKISRPRRQMNRSNRGRAEARTGCLKRPDETAISIRRAEVLRG